MEVVIHGTKGGYRILYKTQRAPSIGSDIRNNVSSEAALGKSAYSISFAANGCVFTKYIIIRDTLRSDATGFIAFSLYLLSSKELLNGGADVKALLDDLSNQYVDKYVRNNSINKGESDIIQEDWSFVNDILERKTEQGRGRNELEIQAGSKEAAIVFYEDDFKLQEYFSKPFQEEYNDYKQILLINGELRNSSADLLNAIRNSGEELKVDLRNDPYYLNNYSPSRGLSMTSNGKLRSDGKKNNVIRAKEKVEIRYTKEYYRPIEVDGTLSNPGSEIYKYLDLKGNQINIKWDEFSSDLKPIEKTLTFNIKDWERNSVSGAEITCYDNDGLKTVKNNEIVFQGDDLGKRWRVLARKNNFFSEEKRIDFENDCPGTSGVVDIVLNKHVLEIIAHEGNLHGDIIANGINASKTEFIDREIEETHRIAVTCWGFESYYFDYCPARDSNPQHIPLRKKQPTYGGTTTYSYSVNPGKNGALKGGNNYLSNTKDGSDVKDMIIPNKGYEFTHFEQEGSALVAQYVNKKNFFKNENFITAIIVAAFIIIVGLLYFLGENDWSVKRLLSNFNKGQKEANKPNIQQLQAYIEGDFLIMKTLDSYKDSLSGRQMQIKGALDSAINKRRFINEFNFAELRKLTYYPSQEQFRKAIFEIDSTEGYKQVKNRFTDVSSWSLTKIADSINAFLDHKPAAADSSLEMEKEVKKSKKEVSQKEGVQSIRPEQKKEEKIVSPPANNNNTNDAINKLQSGTITKDELKKWKAAGMDKLNRSIDLYLKFWDMVTSSQKNDFDKLLSEIKADAILKSSELKSFLNSICANSDAFEKYNVISGKAACKTINELQKKLK